MVLRQSQFSLGLSSAEAMAACGPAAAIAFAQTYGRNPTNAEAIQLARNVGWSSAGMKGPGSEQALLNQMGISTKLTNGVDWNAVGQEANTGNPVIVSTPGHYFFIDGFNPANGSYHVGTSGTDLKSGSEWMNPNQMQGLMGQAQGALFADHPLQGPSAQVPPSNGVQSGGNSSFFNYWYGGGNQNPQSLMGSQQQSAGIPAEFANKPYANEAYQAAINAGIDPNIFLRQINQESGFNPNAGSSAGAQGIAQIVPKYHPGVNTADPVASLNYAANLDKQLLGQYGGDYTKAMIAYNGGQGAVDAWNSGQGYAESKTYVNNILGGQTPSQFTGQSGQQQGIQQPSGTQQSSGTQPVKKQSALSQIIKMGGMYTTPDVNSSIFTPSNLTQALSNSYDTSAPPPTAQSNPISMFSNIFTGTG